MFFKNKKKGLAELTEATLEQENLTQGYDPVKSLEALPVGVEIRRVAGRKHPEHKWCVRYKTGTKFYGETISDALNELLMTNETVAMAHIENGGSWPVFEARRP